jgi:hypothetical protein
MQGFLTTDGHEIYTDGFDRIERMRARGLMALFSYRADDAQVPYPNNSHPQHHQQGQ